MIIKEMRPIISRRFKKQISLSLSMNQEPTPKVGFFLDIIPAYSAALG